jgi:hypothetical protein
MQTGSRHGSRVSCMCNDVNNIENMLKNAQASNLVM